MRNVEPPHRRPVRASSIGHLLATAAILGALAVLGGIGLWVFGIPALG